MSEESFYEFSDKLITSYCHNDPFEYDIDDEGLTRKDLLGYACEKMFSTIDNYKDFKFAQSLFLKGYLYGSFSYGCPIFHCKETIPYMRHLNEMLSMEFISLGSQPGHHDIIEDEKVIITAEDHSCPFGFGYIDGLIHKKYLTDLSWLKDIDVLLLIDDTKLYHGDKELMKVERPSRIAINVLGDRKKPSHYKKHLFIRDDYSDEKENEIKRLHENVKQYIRENFIYVEFIHPYTGDNGIFNIVLKALKKFNNQ